MTLRRTGTTARFTTVITHIDPLTSVSSFLRYELEQPKCFPHGLHTSGSSVWTLSSTCREAGKQALSHTAYPVQWWYLCLGKYRKSWKLSHILFTLLVFLSTEMLSRFWPKLKFSSEFLFYTISVQCEYFPTSKQIMERGGDSEFLFLYVLSVFLIFIFFVLWFRFKAYT